MSNYLVAGLDQPMFEYLACYVTVMNSSKQRLLNAQVVKNWGKYTTDPITNIEPGVTTKFVMKGRDGAVSGCEGSVTYDVGDIGLGSVNFSYTCPYSGDNEAVPSNNSPVLILQVYANNNKDYYWNPNGTGWGDEGQVPNDGNPLSILFVVRDLAPGPANPTSKPAY